MPGMDFETCPVRRLGECADPAQFDGLRRTARVGVMPSVNFQMRGAVPPARPWARATRSCPGAQVQALHSRTVRSEEHTSELQSLMRISYAVFCLKKKKA